MAKGHGSDGAEPSSRCFFTRYELLNSGFALVYRIYLAFDPMPDDAPDRKRPAHLPGLEFRNRTTIYFVTVCTHDRQPVLATKEAHALLLTAWAEADFFLIGRYVIMPDHIHLFCAPAHLPPSPLKSWMTFWKSRMTRNWPDRRENGLWQINYWDTQLRRGDSYATKWAYVRNNPVRAGLAGAPEEWPYQGELNRLEWND